MYINNRFAAPETEAMKVVMNVYNDKCLSSMVYTFANKYKYYKANCKKRSVLKKCSLEWFAISNWHFKIVQVVILLILLEAKIYPLKLHLSFLLTLNYLTDESGLNNNFFGHSIHKFA